MLGFARNIVFFRVNRGSAAEKSWLASLTSGAACWPDVLTHLHLGDRHCRLQCVGLPSAVQHLELGHSFNQPICDMQWSHLLQTLHFGMDSNRPLQNVLLPAALCELRFGNRFDQPRWMAFAGHRSCGFCNLVLISISPWLPQICPANSKPSR